MMIENKLNSKKESVISFMDLMDTDETVNSTRVSRYNIQYVKDTQQNPLLNDKGSAYDSKKSYII